MKPAFAFAQPQLPVLPANEPSRKKCKSFSKKECLFFICILFLGLGDVLAKKAAISEKLPEIKTAFLHLTYFANPGIAFSIPIPQTLTLFITGIVIILFTILHIKTQNTQEKIALTAALVGATSNFFDRLLTGYTTDYIVLFNTSAINIADILIIAGIGSYAWYHKKADEKNT